MTTQTAEPIAATVPNLWPGSTVVCLGSGPSLTPEDVDFCRGRARVIAVKDTIRLAPWADVLYSGEIKWWQHYGPTLAFDGLRYGIECEGMARVASSLNIGVLRNTGFIGLETDPSGLRTGKNSGYQAIGIARHLGARRIVLLGYDMQVAGSQPHFFGDHPYPRSNVFRDFVPLFETLLAPLKALGIAVVNCSRETALTCF
ncbi:MAG: hypothetical protein ABI665_23710, partial [Vicinamibacterales bacterium]